MAYFQGRAVELQVGSCFFCVWVCLDDGKKHLEIIFVEKKRSQ